MVKRSAVLVVAALSAACRIGFPPPEGAIPQIRANRRHPPDQILLLAGRPTRPFAPLTFVAKCGVEPLVTIREQAADAGGDAIIELSEQLSFAGECASGLAVSFP
jgi:hypothetical protein